MNQQDVIHNVDENSKTSNTEKLEKKPSAFSKFAKKHPVLMTILCGMIVVVIVYFWKEVEGNLRRKALIEAATNDLQENNQKMLVLFSKPLVWNIRSEMLRGNMEQVNLLISDLVKEKNFRYIQLVELNGNILLSTNKKMEGQAVDNENIKGALAADSTVLIKGEDNMITVISPVMGYDKRMASLVICYMPDSFNAPEIASATALVFPWEVS